MTTGYTALIEDKEDVTFRQFVLRCARAFLIDQRDDDINTPPRPRQVDDYYIKEVQKIRARLAELESITLKQAEIIAAGEYEESMARHNESNRKHEELGARYKRIRTEVVTWLAPTKMHNLKEFMLEQIGMSWYERDPDQYKPVRLTGEEWLTKNLAREHRSAAWAVEELAKEEQRCRETNKWLEELMASLPPPQPTWNVQKGKFEVPE